MRRSFWRYISINFVLKDKPDQIKDHQLTLLKEKMILIYCNLNYYKNRKMYC